MQARTILIDGYNVIRNTPGLAAAERCSLEAGREALRTLVAAKYRHTAHTVLVVFDGDGDSETTEAVARGVRGRVIFTRRGETADEMICRIAQEERAAGREVVVASDDLEVRLRTAEQGSHTARVGELAQRLNAPPKHLERLARHRAFVRRSLEADTDEPPQDRSRGNPRRAPKRRRGGPDSPL